MAGWVEVADGVLVLRHDLGPVDVNTTAVVGPTGVVVVDALGAPRHGVRARDLLADVVEVPVVLLVHSHAHWDHTFGAAGWTGTAAGRAPTTCGHRRLAEHLRDHEAAELAARRPAGPPLDDPGLWDDVVLAPPDLTVTGRTTLRPGGRDLVLHALPPAHTTCDLLVHVPDAGVWVAGDVVEESGPPSLEVDSDAAGWAQVLDRLAARMGRDDVVVPGHGACVDREFVRAQARELARVAGRR